MNLKRLLVSSFTVFTIAVLAACTANESCGEEEPDSNDASETEDTEEAQEEDTDDKSLYFNNGEESPSLDPSIGFDEGSWDPTNHLREGLTRLSVDHTAQEGLAEA